MPLLRCPDCRNDVEDSAECCPVCGRHLIDDYTQAIAVVCGFALYPLMGYAALNGWLDFLGWISLPFAMFVPAAAAVFIGKKFGGKRRT